MIKRLLFLGLMFVVSNCFSEFSVRKINYGSDILDEIFIIEGDSLTIKYYNVYKKGEQGVREVMEYRFIISTYTKSNYKEYLHKSEEWKKEKTKNGNQ